MHFGASEQRSAKQQPAPELKIADMVKTAALAADGVLTGKIPVSVANATARNLESGLELMKAQIYHQRMEQDKQGRLAQLGDLSLI